MGFTIQQLDNSKITCHYAGNNSRTTYYVDGKAYCFRQRYTQPEQYCSQLAGYGTAHPNIGACKFHNANKAEAVMLYGYSKHLKGDLHRVYAEYEQMDEQALMDLSPELVMLRTLLADSLGIFQDSKSLNALDRCVKLLTSIGMTVEQIDRIQSRRVLTAATVKLIFAKAIQVALQFMEPDRVPEFIDLWRKDVSPLMASKEPIQIDIPALASIIEE